MITPGPDPLQLPDLPAGEGTAPPCERRPADVTLDQLAGRLDALCALLGADDPELEPGVTYRRALLENLERKLAEMVAHAIGNRADAAAGYTHIGGEEQAKRYDLEAAYVRRELVRLGLWPDEQAGGAASAAQEEQGRPG